MQRMGLGRGNVPVLLGEEGFGWALVPSLRARLPRGCEAAWEDVSDISSMTQSRPVVHSQSTVPCAGLRGPVSARHGGWRRLGSLGSSRHSGEDFGAKSSVLCRGVCAPRVRGYATLLEAAGGRGVRALPVHMHWGGERGVLTGAWGGWLLPARDAAICMCVGLFFTFFSLGG